MYDIPEKTDNIVEDNYKEDINRRDSTISKNCNCSNTKGPRIQLKHPFYYCMASKLSEYTLGSD